jgi:hypothetical protein
MDPPADAPAPPDPGVVPPGFVQNVEGAFGQLGNTLTTILTLLNTLVLNSSVNATANASATAPAPMPHVLPPGVKPPTPDSFDAAQRPLVATWLTTTEATLRLAGHNLNAPDTILYVSSFLRRRAADWYTMRCSGCTNEHLKPYGGFSTWAEFAHAFLHDLGEDQPRDRARERLIALRQTTSVLNYGERFVNAIKFLPDMHWEDQRFYYLRGLKPGIQQMLAGKYADQDRWPALHEQAMKCDNFRVPGLNPRSFSPSSYSTSAASSSSTPMDLGNVNAHGRPKSPTQRPSTPCRLKPLTPEEREDLRRKNACFRCRQAGHTSATCPVYSQPPYNQTKFKSGPPSRKSSRSPSPARSKN